MTKSSIISDLHLNIHPLGPLPGGDLLILPGDIWEIIQMRPNANDAKSRSLRKSYIKFIKEELSKYDTVLYVKGNHEPYNIFWEDANRILLGFLKEHDINSHIKLLDNDSIIIEGIKFIGSTLWATYGYNTVNQAAIQVGMPDLYCIKKRDNSDVANSLYGRNLLVEEIYEEHQKCKKFIEQELKDETMPCVVITHHPPSYLVEGNPMYSVMDDCFMSNQHEIINKYAPKMWIYGHTHESRNFMIEKTRLVSNQRGYFGYEQCAKYFDPAAEDFDLEELKKD